ncbi:hypothetical protein GCM10022381_30150 [Leifsonia kafniensis]|uniref:Periplasmic binding protein domain-containing protein n=1 Tax=Leifsonia kafniensis TaxID=475957 RepID=A0ABP7KUL8_9MICO
MKRNKFLATLALVSVGAIALAGCSAETGGATTDPSSSTASIDLASFEQRVDAWSTAPQPWAGPDSTPTPPKGTKLAIVSCSGIVAGCAAQAAGAEEAAKALGWDVTVYDGKGDPVTQNQAVVQAVNSGVDAIILASTDRVLVQSGLALASERGIPVGSTGLGSAASDSVLYDVGPDFFEMGRAMAAWVVVDSGGKANILFTDNKEFESTGQITSAFAEVIKECSTCVLSDPVQFTVSEVGNGLGSRIAGLLQTMPNVDYVMGAFNAPAADMVNGITNFGLADRVKVVAAVGGEQNLQFVKEGNVQAMDAAQDNRYMGFAAVDQMIRVLTDNPLWEDPQATSEETKYAQHVPIKLFTTDNITSTSEWVADNGYDKEYFALWGVKP